MEIADTRLKSSNRRAIDTVTHLDGVDVVRVSLHSQRTFAAIQIVDVQATAKKPRSEGAGSLSLSLSLSRSDPLSLVCLLQILSLSSRSVFFILLFISSLLTWLPRFFASLIFSLYISLCLLSRLDPYRSEDPPSISLESFEKLIENRQKRCESGRMSRGSWISCSPRTLQKCTHSLQSTALVII